MGVSLSMLNGDIFNDDDLPIECRSVLEGEYEVALSYGRNQESFYNISCPRSESIWTSIHPSTYQAVHGFRPDEGTRGEEEYMYADHSSTSRSLSLTPSGDGVSPMCYALETRLVDQ